MTMSAVGTRFITTTTDIETPEGVRLAFRLAGPGSRFLAYLIDLALRGVLVWAFSVGLGVIGIVVPLSGLPFGVLMLALFLIEWGYACLFEGLWNGRTPGKRVLGLRVIREGGYPISFYDALLRNLLRAADGLPVLYGLGLLSVVATPRMQRLGDLVAGTLVVREERPRFRSRPTPGGNIPPLDRKEIFSTYRPAERLLDLIERLSARRRYVVDDRAREIAAILAGPLARRLAYEPDGPAARGDPERFLLRVLKTFSGETPPRPVPSTAADRNRARFTLSRQPQWRRFEELLDKAERGAAGGLEADDVSEFSRLFRSVSHDLALVRTRDWGRDLEQYLNDLTARGHNRFYGSAPGRPREILRFFTRGFPRLLRAHVAYFWVALVLFVGPGVVCGTLVARDQSFALRVLSGTQLSEIEAMHSKLHQGTGVEAMAAGFYVQNNVGVAFRCFATGIFFGLGSVFFLVFNSIVLGTIVGYLVVRGHGTPFLSFVISHGAFELTAIVVAGAAGLVIGHALVHPGGFTRGESLRRRGLIGVRLAAGAAGMLAVAALIEAFWSPSPAPPPAKFVVGGLLWGLVAAYLALAGRGGRGEDGP